MKQTNVQLLRIVLLTIFLASVVTPAGALEPEGKTLAFGNMFGQLMDCVRIRPCSGRTCEARAIYSRADGTCTRSTPSGPGLTRMSCTFEDMEWSFWANRSDEVILDITCSERGRTLNHILGKYTANPKLSCSAIVTLVGSRTWTDSYYGLVTSSWRSCRKLFGWPITDEEWRDIRLGDFVD